MSVTRPPSLDFEEERKAYYESKISYTKLRDEAMTRKSKENDTPPVSKTEMSPIHKTDDREFTAWRAPKFPPQKGPTPDVQAMARRVSEMRAASAKGQSKIKKSEWDKIDKLLGT